MDRDAFLREWYRTLHQERWERSRRTWLTLSIFIAGSFLLVSEAVKNRLTLSKEAFFFLMIPATVLVAISGLLQFYTIKLNDSALDFIEEIEDEFGFKNPQTRHEKEKKKWWFKIKPVIWSILFPLLFVADVLIMFLFYP